MPASEIPSCADADFAVPQIEPQQRPATPSAQELLRLGVPAVALLVVLLAVVASHGQPLSLDLAVQDVLQGRREALAALLTQLGSGALLYPLLLIVAVAETRRGARLSQAFLPIVVLAAGQVLEAVTFVTLHRPSATGGPDLSFSSGHALTAVLGWGLIAGQVGGRLSGALPVALGATAGLSRVVLGLHWTTDVLAGWALGALLLSAYGTWTRYHPLVETGPAPAVGAARPQHSVETWLHTSRWSWLLPAAASLVPLVPLLTAPGPERMKDLLVYVGAGGRAGSGADVYEFRTVFDMPFTYPPFAALLSEPLSRVPLGLLQALWAAATAVAVVALARVAMRPVVDRLGLPLTVALLLLSSPVRSHLRFGQVGVFLVLLVAFDLLRDRTRSGLGLGVAAAVKLTPAVFLPWLVVTGRWRTFATATLTAAGCTLLGLGLLWPSTHEYLWRALWDSDRFGPNDIAGNQSVRGMLLRSGLPQHSAEVLWLVCSLILVVVATVGARKLAVVGNRLGALGVLAALSIAVSPISWVHHLVWLVLPVAALVGAGRWRLALSWGVILTVSLPSLGSAGLRGASGPDVLWQLVIDAQGLTAVAAAVLLPSLLTQRPPESSDPAATGD